MPCNSRIYTYFSTSFLCSCINLRSLRLLALLIAYSGLFVTSVAAQGGVPALPVPLVPGSNYAKKCNPGGLRNAKGAIRFATVADGVRAMDALLVKDYFNNSKYNTIEKYVPRYVGEIGAQKIEIYKRNVSAWSGIPRNKIIDIHDRKMRNAILAAALRQESGGDWRQYVNHLFREEEMLAENDR